jgi:hypothetical protein
MRAERQMSQDGGIGVAECRWRGIVRRAGRGDTSARAQSAGGDAGCQEAAPRCLAQMPAQLTGDRLAGDGIDAHRI